MQKAAQSASRPPERIRFGLFEVHVAANTLTRNGTRVKIHDQPLCVLLALLERPGEVVTREELRQKVWTDGTYVDFDDCLNVILKKLRAAIDDDSNNPRFIETVPRKGYRFIAPVEIIPAHSEGNGRPPAPAAAGNGAISSPKEFKLSWRKVAGIGGVCAVLALAAAVLFHLKSENDTLPPAPSVASVAVVPFQNWGAGSSFDYLRFALASDIVTDLTYARSISVRPFTSTVKYAAYREDPQTLGREMNVSYVITGYFANESGRLAVTAEMVRVADDRVVWSDTLSSAPSRLMHLHDDFVWSLQKGVFAALNTSDTAAEIPSPHSQRAYELYLRSVAVPRDPGPNKEAIADLEESVKEDPNYPPAWAELAWRYYIDASYSNGGEAEYQKSEAASAHAASLDPRGTANWITIRTEHGDLQGAYDLAQKLLAWRPDFSASHFEMSYVYRYAGLLDQAAQECDAALDRDPGNPTLRSCSKVFMYKGDYRQAQTYVNLDGSSGWSVRQRMNFALRQKNDAEALALAKVAVDTGYSDSEIVRDRLENLPGSVLNAVAAREESFADKQADSEEVYEIGAMLSFAGQPDRAMRVIRTAIRKNYCAVPMLEADPLLAPLRERSDFQELATEAEACQRKFLTHARMMTTPGF